MTLSPHRLRLVDTISSSFVPVISPLSLPLSSPPHLVCHTSLSRSPSSSYPHRLSLPHHHLLSRPRFVSPHHHHPHHRRPPHSPFSPSFHTSHSSSSSFSSLTTIMSSSSSAQRDLHSLTVAVTGATRGIGRGIALAFAEHGAHLILTGRNPSSGPFSLSALREAALSAGASSCSTYVVDHSDTGSVARFFDSMNKDLAIATPGPRVLDVFVNNAYAAVKTLAYNAERGTPFWNAVVRERSVTPEDEQKENEEKDEKDNDDPAVMWDMINNVGLRNNYICSVYAMRLMLKQRGADNGGNNGDNTNASSSNNVQHPGIIVNVSSVGSIMSLFSPAYCTGKAGIDRLSAEFALQTPPSQYPIRFICFHPGAVDTEEIGAIARQRREQQPQGNHPKSSSSKDPPDIPEWNLETPLFVGRTLVEVVKRPDVVERAHGKVVLSADVGYRYDVKDEKDFTPMSFRSLSFLLFMGVPWLRESPLGKVVPRAPILPWFLIREAIGAVKFM